MATVFTEDWGGASLGTSITSANSGYTQLLGASATATFDGTVQVGGKTQCAKVTTPVTATTAILDEDSFSATSERVMRRYFRADALPAVAMSFMVLRGASTIRAAVRLSPDGTFQLRNGNTSSAATSSFALSTGETVRLEWHFEDTVVNELRIFHGANLNGSTPDETYTHSSVPNQGTCDQFRQGVINAEASLTLYFAADLDDDATFPGTAVDSGDAECPTPVAAAHNPTVTTGGGTSAIAECATATAVGQDASGSSVVPTISFVGSAGAAANTATATVTLPALQAGDLIVFGLAHVDTVTYSDPAGYTPVAATATDGSLSSRMWWKFATAGDSQATLSISLSGTTKWNLCLEVLRGTHGTVPIESAGTPTTQTGTAANDFTAPAVSAPTAGSWLAHFVSERGPLAGTWTPPVTRSERQDVGNLTGSAQSSSCLADSNGTVATGSQPATTFTSTQAVDSRIGWTLVVAPSVTSGATSASAECATATVSAPFDQVNQSISVELTAATPVEVLAQAGEVTVQAVSNTGGAEAPTAAAAAQDATAKVAPSVEAASAAWVGLDTQGGSVAPTAEVADAAVEAGNVSTPVVVEAALVSAVAFDVTRDPTEQFSNARALDASITITASAESASAAVSTDDPAPSAGASAEAALAAVAALDVPPELLAELASLAEDPSAKVAVSAGVA